MRLRVAAVLGASALCAGLFAFVAVPPAAAVGGVEVSIGGDPFTAAPSKSLMTLDDLAPGSLESAVMGIRNTTSATGSITFKFVDATSSENGCTPAELALDPSCDPNGPGQLPTALTFEIARSASQAGPFAPVWIGTVGTLEGPGVTVDKSLAAYNPANGDGTEWMQLTVSLPLWAGNELQSDTFSFGASVELTTVVAPLIIPPPTSSSASSSSVPPTSSSAGGGGAVGGVSTSASPPGGGSQGISGQSTGQHSLASTGLDIALLTMIGITLIFCGALFLLRFRTSRQH
jgi:hypothetical protein